MADRDLTPGGFGEAVGSLHRRLSALGIAVPDSEVERRFFGPGTQLAVREFQRRQRLPVTGTVDEATAAAIDAAHRARPREAAERQPAPGPTRPTVQPASLARYASRLVDGYVRFGEELWGRSWNVAAESLRRAVGEVEGSAVGPRGPQQLLGNLLAEYANYVSDMAMVLPLAVETAAERIGGRRRRMPGEEDGAGDGTAPRTLGRMIDWPGSGAGALALPVRCLDASQGWAVYVVLCERATALLGSSADFLIPFDLGGRRTLLAVLGTDYRASDLGRYQEIALALAVTPRHAPMGVPGAMFLGIGVSGEFARDAARAIWGLRKVFNKDLSVAYRADRVDFGLGSDPQIVVDRLPALRTAAFGGHPRINLLATGRRRRAQRHAASIGADDERPWAGHSGRRIGLDAPGRRQPRPLHLPGFARRLPLPHPGGIRGQGSPASSQWLDRAPLGRSRRAAGGSPQPLGNMPRYASRSMRSPVETAFAA